MTEEAIFAGFGGQGVLSMGMMLAYSGMKEGKEVCWMPSYGPEMRGGTANCITIISDSLISSPIISRFDTVVALNQPSVEKFEDKIKPGGAIIYDKSNILNPTYTLRYYHLWHSRQRRSFEIEKHESAEYDNTRCFYQSTRHSRPRNS
jgi:Pyruvate/2-oxoacid:ferredoxin oxidoreductase gamma subunit